MSTDPLEGFAKAHVNRYGRPEYGASWITRAAELLSDASRARAGARALWLMARSGSDVSAVAEALARSVEHGDPHTAFFAAMALACTDDRAAAAQWIGRAHAAVEGVEAPDVGERTRFASYVGTFTCDAGAPGDAAPAEETPAEEMGENWRCGVCAARALVLVHHDGYADNAGRWEEWRYHCPECGFTTHFVHDD